MNIGILGLAHSHVMSYGKVWRDNPEMGISITAAWDHDAGRLSKQADELGVPRCFSDADELLALSDIEAVVISSETLHHAELVKKAARKKKKIVLYKPMALTLAQADSIVEAVVANGVDFTMGWQMRDDPQNLKMRELVRDGKFGKLFMLRRRHCLSTHLWDWFPASWHADLALNRDIWADDASHVIDFIYWMLGLPASVTAEISSLLDPAVPNDNGVAIFKYPDGRIAEAFCSFTCGAAESTTEIYCEKGTILQYFGDGPSTSHPRPEGQCGLKWQLNGVKGWTDSGIPSPASHGERIAWQATPLAGFLHGRRPPVATAEEGRNALKMVLATYLSNREGRRVTLDDKRLYEI
jgi:predicted dehydrogenase